MNASAPPADIIDRLEQFARRASAWFMARVVPMVRFGSPASMALSAGVGFVTLAGALASWPVSEAPASVARTAQAPVSVAMTPAIAPVGAPPPPPVQIALDYDVVFYWPKTPQTVAEPVAIRTGPAGYAKVLRSARPGERLRINGRVDDAPGGPWLRVRLEDGSDGYFAANTMDVGAFRRRRVEAPAVELDVVAPEVTPDQTGAPLLIAGPAAEPEPSPSF